MGVIINRQIEDRDGNILDSFYGRIEHFVYGRIDGYFRVHANFYTTKEGAANSFAEYLYESSPSGAAILPPQVTSISHSIEISGSTVVTSSLVELPIFTHHMLTSSFEVIEDVYETQYISQSYDYTDYDEEGNLVPMTGYEVVGQQIKAGEQVVTKYKAIAPLTSSMFEIGYERLKDTLGQMFGTGSIVDDI